MKEFSQLAFFFNFSFWYTSFSIIYQLVVNRVQKYRIYFLSLICIFAQIHIFFIFSLTKHIPKRLIPLTIIKCRPFYNFRIYRSLIKIITLYAISFFVPLTLTVLVTGFLQTRVARMWNSISWTLDSLSAWHSGFNQFALRASKSTIDLNITFFFFIMLAAD